MNIDCYLVTKGEFKPVVIPEELYLQLSKNIRTRGKEIVQFSDKSIECEGIYVPAKGVKGMMMIANDFKEGETE